MRLLTFNTKKLNFDIVLHGDTHEGSQAFCEQGVDSLLKWIMRSPNRYYVHMGDAIEGIRVDDPRFNPEAGEIISSIAGRQRDSVINRYRKTAKRCIAWLMGNHEYYHTKSFNPTADICSSLKIPYGGYTCKLAIKYKQRLLFKIYLWHGPKNLRLTSNAKDFAQRKANMQAAVRRCLESKACDCLVMAFGHIHKLILVPPAERLLISDDGYNIKQSYLTQGKGSSNYIEPDARWYLSTGSYRQTSLLNQDDYAEMTGYDPVELGHCVLKIRNGVLQNIDRVVFSG